MKKFGMILMFLGLSFILYSGLSAMFDNIDEGNNHLNRANNSSWHNEKQASAAVAQAYYLKDIAESLRVIKDKLK